MSTFANKVASSVAGLAIVFSIVSPIAGVAAAFTSLESANKLSTLGVIVDQSANPVEYRLGDNLPRKEAVKVMMNLSSIAVVDNCEGKFSDLMSTNWACKYAETALANGMVAANATFGPDRLLSKIEGLKMVFQGRDLERNEDSDWRVGYVDAAVEMGISDRFEDYDTAITRGQFFIWAANAIEAVSVEDDLLCEILGTCDDETDPTDPEAPVVTGGDVEISLAPGSAANGMQVPNNGTIRFAKVAFTAGDRDVSVNTVDVSSLGLAAVDTTTRVWFEQNGKRLSGKAAFSSDRTAVVSFSPALDVQAGKTVTLDMYVLLNTNAGNDFQFSGKITTSSASNNNGMFTTNNLRTATYTVAPVIFTALGSATSYNQSSDLVELGRFTVQNNDTSSETRDVEFQNITLRQAGNGDVLDLSELQIERNGVKVSSEVNTNGKDVTFVLNDTVKDGATATYYVRAKVDTVQNTSDTYQFSLRNDTDLNAVEVLNGFRSKVNGTLGNLALYSVTGADIVFARDTAVELSANVSKGTNNVTFLKGTITSKSAITLENPELTFTFPTTLGATSTSSLDTVYLKIGSSVMTWSADGTGTAKFSGLATVNGKADVEVYAKLKDTAPTGTIKFGDIRLTTFQSALNGGKVEYVSNQNPVTASVGSISAITVSVDSTGLTTTRVDGLGNTSIASGSKAIKLYGLNLKVSQGNPVSISNPVFSIVNSSGSQLQLSNVFATLYIDGVAAQTKTVTGTGVSFNSVTKTVSSSAPVLMEVVVDLADAFTGGDLTVQLTSLDATDSLTSAVVALGTVPSSATFTVATPIATAYTSDSNPKASLLLAGAQNQKLLAFRVKGQFDSVRLRDLSFTGANLNALSNFRVTNEAGDVVAAGASTISSSSVLFTNISTSDVVGDEVTKTYYLVADVNTNTNVAGVVANLDTASSNFRPTNGTTLMITGASVAGVAHTVADSRVIVAKVTNPSKVLTTSALRFSVTGQGKNATTLNTLNFGNIFSGYTTTSAKIVVYKDSISSGNKLGETATGTVTGSVTLSDNNTVDVNSTNNYIVAIEGIVVDGTANSQDWNIVLSNVTFNGGTSTATFENLGSFPITEVK